MTMPDPESDPHFSDRGSDESNPMFESPESAPGESAHLESGTADRIAEFHRKLVQATPRVIVTPILIGINVLVFIIMVASGVHLMEPSAADLIKWGANFALKTLDGEWWRLLTCCFIHIGVIHILLNMWVLADAGRLIERMFGSRRFLGLYLFSGLFGSLASLYWNPILVSAGASGAVFGVYGALLGALIRHARSIPVEALSQLRNSGITFVGFNLFYGMIHPNIDSAAHLGGLAGGFLSGLVLELAIDRVTSRRRPVLAVIVGVASLLLLLGGVTVVNSHHGNLIQTQRELDRFVKVEATVIERVNAAVAKLQTGEMDDPKFAIVLKNDVLPDWRDSISRLSELKPTGPFKQNVESLLAYMRLREAHWSLLEQACATSDQQLATQAAAKGALADAALQQLVNKANKK